MLNNSDHQAVLFLGNLVEGKYSFTLTVTDSKGQSSTSSGSVEVKAGNWTHASLRSKPQSVYSESAASGLLSAKT